MSGTTLCLACRYARYTAAAKLSDMPTVTWRVYLTIPSMADLLPSVFAVLSIRSSEMHDFASCISSSKRGPFVIKNGADCRHTRQSPPAGIRGVRAGAATLTRVLPLLSGGHVSHGDAALLLSPSECEPTPPTPYQKLHGTSKYDLMDGGWSEPPTPPPKLQLSADVFKK